jgi:hypothetical protein
MKRNYDKASGVTDITLFVGKEIERTPAYGMKTLFVVGTETSLAEIIEHATHHECTHIYLGANMSFNVELPNGTDEENKVWDNLVMGLLKADFWVTLDFETKYTDWVLECGFTEYRRFIPMISVRIPYIDQLGYNACIKIDDIDFDATNEGVWVHSLHKLMDRSVFTDWDQYTQDHIIK